jgi:hypothetical protein
MWFHYDFMLHCGVNRGMRTFVLLTRIAVHASACRKSSESHTFFQSIHQDYVLPSFMLSTAVSGMFLFGDYCRKDGLLRIKHFR